MRVCYLQHVSFEGLAAIEPWLEKQGHTVFPVHLFAGDTLPSSAEFDWLIAMGGPMGANDDHLFDWMTPEKELIGVAIDEGKVVLGICLGAQLIAAALGAGVYTNVEREIGWLPIRSTFQAADHTLGKVLPAQCEVFHWHGDTFDLPTNAVRLASSEGCLNQAFCIGDRVLALQFHLETTPDTVSNLVGKCHDEISAGGRYVQAPEQILESPERFERANRLMVEVLTALANA